MIPLIATCTPNIVITKWQGIHSHVDIGESSCLKMGKVIVTSKSAPNQSKQESEQTTYPPFYLFHRHYKGEYTIVLPDGRKIHVDTFKVYYKKGY